MVEQTRRRVRLDRDHALMSGGKEGQIVSGGMRAGRRPYDDFSSGVERVRLTSRRASIPGGERR
jgi:hypothetical protein